MLSKYDAVVVGAGPAGSMAAYEIASAGFSTLLLEKHKRPGLPLCCAEAVSRPALERIIVPADRWISTSIEKVRIVAPNGVAVELYHPRAGYVLDRTFVDNDLALRAQKAGCDLQCETIALEMAMKNGHFNSIRAVKSDGSTVQIEARVFIAADGVESKIARQAGLNNLIDVRDVAALFQYRLDDISIDPSTIEFHFGNDIAPGSYVWVFPKSDRSANVGLGVVINGHKGVHATELLNRFLERRFSSARIAGKACGLVPRYQGEGMFRLANLLVVGDAARAVDSLSGAGIVNGMMSGKYAGLAAAEFLFGRVSDVDQIDELYPGRFLKEKADELKLYAKMRQVFDRLNDDDFLEIISALKIYFGENAIEGINARKLLAGLMKSRPRLLRLLRHLV